MERITVTNKPRTVSGLQRDGKMTDKQIKAAIVYNETPMFMTNEEIFKFDAYHALWEEIKNTFINDEDLKPVDPSSQ